MHVQDLTTMIHALHEVAALGNSMEVTTRSQGGSADANCTAFWSLSMSNSKCCWSKPIKPDMVLGPFEGLSSPVLPNLRDAFHWTGCSLGPAGQQSSGSGHSGKGPSPVELLPKRYQPCSVLVAFHQQMKTELYMKDGLLMSCDAALPLFNFQC